MPLLFHIEQKPLCEQSHQQHPAAAAVRPVAMRGEGRSGHAVDGDEAAMMMPSVKRAVKYVS